MSWQRVQLKRLFASTTGGSWGTDPDDGEVVLPCVRGTDFDYPRLRVDASRAPARGFAKSDVKRRAAVDGDLIIEKSGGGPSQPVGRAVLYVADEHVMPTNFAGRLRPVSGADPSFLTYLMASLYSDGRTRAAIKQTTGIQNLDLEELLSNVVIVPGLAEQRAIADYLDTETARIDALITKKRRMIELVDERRRNFVSRAVTGGMAAEELVETGNRYAKSIPARWRLMRLRHVVERIVDTPHKTAPVVDGAPYLVVRTANVKQGRLVFTDARYTDRESWIEWNRRGEPRPGDVLFTREAPAGEACVVPDAPSLCIGQRMVLLQVDTAVTCGEWVVHSIYSGPAQRFIEDLSNSTTVAHINMSDIPDMPIAIPDLVEQRRLLRLIAGEINRADGTSEALSRQIELLAEHRQALITAAVTGEIKVPGVAA